MAKGARQLVVQDALDTMGALGSYVSQFTPTTYVGMSEPLAGAVMSTCTFGYYEDEHKGNVLLWCSQNDGHHMHAKRITVVLL